MVKFSFFVITFFLFSHSSFGKDYQSFSSDLSNLKSKYRKIVHYDIDVVKFKNSIEDLEWPLNELEKDLIDYIGTQKIVNNDELNTLLIEIGEFKSFTLSSTCECLFYFNKFLKEIGAQSFFIKQQENIKAFVAVVGNFKFYYAYSLNYWLQDVTINTIMTNGHETYGFGLYEEVEIFRITTKNENIKPFNIKVKVLNKEKKTKYNECEDKFPRL